MDFSKLTIMDFEDLRHTIPDTMNAGAQYVQDRVTRENLGDLATDELMELGIDGLQEDRAAALIMAAREPA